MMIFHVRNLLFQGTIFTKDGFHETHRGSCGRPFFFFLNKLSCWVHGLKQPMKEAILKDFWYWNMIVHMEFIGFGCRKIIHPKGDVLCVEEPFFLQAKQKSWRETSWRSFFCQALTLKQAIKNDYFNVAAKSRLWSITHSSKRKFRRYFWTKEKRDAVFNLLGTNISPNKALLKMIFLFQGGIWYVSSLNGRLKDSTAPRTQLLKFCFQLAQCVLPFWLRKQEESCRCLFTGAAALIGGATFLSAPSAGKNLRATRSHVAETQAQQWWNRTWNTNPLWSNQWIEQDC